MDPIDLFRSKRIVLLIDLDPLLRLQDPGSYITPILSAARRILSSPPLTGSCLAAYRFFFSSLSPILSTSRVHRLIGKSPAYLSFDLPLHTLESLSQSLNSLTAASDSGDAASPTSPRLSLLARSLLQLEHDYAWEPQTQNRKGTHGFLSVHSNLVLLFSPISQLEVEAGFGDGSLLSPDDLSKKFIQNFGSVSERFVSRDIHCSWLDVNFYPRCKEDSPSLQFYKRGVRELGWGLSSTDAIVLGSALVPFDLIFPYIGCPIGFMSTGGIDKGRTELVLGITDVSGDPLECKSCHLEVVEVKPLIEISDMRALFSGICGSNITKICLTGVLRINEGGEVVDNSCCLVLLCRFSGECVKDSGGHYSEGFFADRVLESLCMNKCEFMEGKPVWQLILAFLYKKSYCALVSVFDKDGNCYEGILKPFTINYALLSIAGKNSTNSCRLVTRMSSRSVDIVNSHVLAQSKSKDGRKRRNKIKDVTWSSFCEAVFSQADDIASGMDLEDIYFARECNKSKKLRFLKCWMRQMEKSYGCCHITPNVLSEPPIVEGEERVLDLQEEIKGEEEEEERVSGLQQETKGEERRILDSHQESEELSSSSGGTHLSGLMSADALPFSCVDDPEAFIGSIPQKIENGLCSEEADLGNFAERFVDLSIYTLFFKFGWNAVENTFKEGEDASDVNIAAEVCRLLLKNPKDLTLKYKGFDSSSLAPDPNFVIQRINNKIREHELQILFRMEILRSKISASIEENAKQKMTKEICSLLRNIEFDLQGESFCGESLLDFAGRTVKSRYAHSLVDVIHKIYSQMEFYSFDKDEVEVSDSLPNSNNDDLRRDEDDYNGSPGDAIGSTVGASRSEGTIHLQENIARIQQEETDKMHEQKLLKAQERRYKAQRFASFTSWTPDLQRVWALKPPRVERLIHDSLPKMSKRRKRQAIANDMVCETPMSGKKLSPVQGDDIRIVDCHNNMCRSLPKALFPDE